MGREVKRVPMDFDWPMRRIWPGYLRCLCTEEIAACMRGNPSGEEVCKTCRHAARLMGLPILSCNCPEWRTHPPTGDGWQMWETVTEGSPISPVCDSPESLARWLADNKASACGREMASYEQWLAMIVKDGWAPSMIMDSSGLRSGVAGIADIG